MPSWNEKPHVVPAINVNLAKCRCPVSPVSPQHWDEQCAARPAPIPCPIQRSATVQVVLGECSCNRRLTPQPGPHGPECPARPVKVSCSISGASWKESEVTAFELASSGIYPNDALRDACRARWALVKALVLGMPRSEALDADAGDKVLALFTQRDAVYTALADMARFEREYWEAAKSVYVAFPEAHVSSDMQVVDPGDEDCDAPSARWLSAYVDHLIEQVVVLGS